MNDEMTVEFYDISSSKTFTLPIKPNQTISEVIESIYDKTEQNVAKFEFFGFGETSTTIEINDEMLEKNFLHIICDAGELLREGFTLRVKYEPYESPTKSARI